ncbi:MAG: hypothetical protein IJ094_08880 [Bacilli bacterium]|nr:hypothetical protein [Bacilli bacterium]
MFDKVFKFKHNKKEDTYIELDIPYHEITWKVNNVEFRKLYFVDIRKVDADIIFDNFKEFQKSFVSDEFFDYKNRISGFSIIIYFVCYSYEISEYLFTKRHIEYDMDYALKYFITNKEADIFAQSNNDITIEEVSNNFSYGNREIEFKNFNLIFGANASGKTTLIKEYAKKFNVPIYYLNPYSDKNSNNKSISTCILNDFFIFIQECKENDVPLLMDISCWGLLDSRNQVIIIDSLMEYSLNNYVVITACQDNIKDLIKLRVINPNIIEL